MKKFILKATFVFLGLLVPLLSLEMSARVLGIPKLIDQDRYAILNYYQLNPDDASVWCRPRPKFNAPSKKIFALGGSSVTGCCNAVSAQQAFPALLNEKLLPLGYSVENYALSARDSYYHKACVKLLLASGEKPNFWIHYAGHNDFINGRIGYPYISIFFREHPNMFRVANWALENLHLAGMLKNVSQPHLRPISKELFLKHKSIIFEKFKSNLDIIIADIKKSGAQIILVTLVHNLEHPPIFNSAGQSNLAVQNSSHLLYKKGMELKSNGKMHESMEYLKQAKDWDFSGWRAPSEVNQHFRELASQHPDTIILLDLEKVMDAYFLKEGVNCNFFGEINYCDYLHPNRRLHGIMSDLLKDLILDLEKGIKKNHR